MLNTTQQRQPFNPVVWYQNTEFQLATYISPDQARELGTFSDAVDVLWFKGQVAHLAWLAGGSNGITLALTAIDCYSASIADPTPDEVKEGPRWKQAIVLSKGFGSGAGNRLAEIEDALVNRILASFPDNTTGIHWLSKLLLMHDLGHAHAGEIAEHFCIWASHLGLDDDNIGAGDHYESAQHWFRRASDLEGEAHALLAQAISYEKEGDNPTGSGPLGLLQAGWYEDAINILTRNNLSRTLRQSSGMDAQVALLRIKHTEARKRGMDNIVPITGPETDVSELVLAARAALEGKSGVDALHALAELQPPPLAQEMQGASSQGNRTGITSIVPVRYLAPDGRPLGTVQALDPNGTPEALLASSELHDVYQVHFGLVAAAKLQPALHSILDDGGLSESDCIIVAKSSTEVPDDRAVQFGKGIWAGLRGDFVVALHLLVPQIENIVRVKLEADGVQTTSFPKPDVERYKSIEALLAEPEATNTFGEDQLQELLALLTNPNGDGVRNQVAHGLIDDDEILRNEAIYVYVWWFALRMMVGE